MPKENQLDIVLLEELTESGWAGVAAVTCPQCGHEDVVRVFTAADGRMVAFCDAPDQYRVTRRTV
jgi:hypothetical protein